MSAENRPSFRAIQGGSQPEVPYLETPLARFQRHAFERAELVQGAETLQDAEDIEHMNVHRLEREPDDVAAHNAWIGRDNPPPPDPLKGA